MVQPRGSNLLDAHASFDSILDVDHVRREHLREFLGHVRMFDGALQRRQHLSGEFTRTIDRARTRIFAEQLADVVIEVGAPCVLPASFDSHAAEFCTSGCKRRFSRMIESAAIHHLSCVHPTDSSYGDEISGFSAHFAHRSRSMAGFDVQNQEGALLDARPRVVVRTLYSMSEK